MGEGVAAGFVAVAGVFEGDGVMFCEVHGCSPPVLQGFLHDLPRHYPTSCREHIASPRHLPEQSSECFGREK